MRCDQRERRERSRIARLYEEFMVVWTVQAALSRADDWGGSQSRRAVWAWREAGFPPLAAWLAAWLAADDRGQGDDLHPGEWYHGD